MTHGHRSGNWKSPTYISYDSMIARCCRPSHPKFSAYGGAGIKVWPAWRGKGGFAAFLDHLGPRPAGCTLDRIDPAGNYEPGNVRWADNKTQRWNRRDMIAGGPTYWISERAIARQTTAGMPF